MLGQGALVSTHCMRDIDDVICQVQYSTSKAIHKLYAISCFRAVLYIYGSHKLIESKMRDFLENSHRRRAIQCKAPSEYTACRPVPMH